jgi:predicted nucleotidyltransferase
MVKSLTQVNNELREFVELLTKAYNVFAIVLFGSYAEEGRAHDFSDIDLAVFSDDFGENLFEEMKSLFKLRRKIDTDIEPLPFSKRDYFEHENTDFVNVILSHGKVIYKDGKMLI